MRDLISMSLRLAFINVVLVRHGLDEIILATRLLRPVRFVLYLLPWNWFKKHEASRPVRIRRLLEDLGPIFVKFGQILSVRRDLLPEALIQELSRLQDAVPPFDGRDARLIVERAYGGPIEEHFAEFNETPLASASIAQVHVAKLHDGTEVIVKVVRPDIRDVIVRDVALLQFIAARAEQHWPEARRLRPMDVVEEYQATLLDELDMLREAASASQLRRNFDSSELLYVPEIHWGLTRPNVLVMERIRGIPVNDISALEAAHVDKKVLAERGVEIFFKQVFVDNFFHADMHPGNIFVEPGSPDEPRYIAVDFGIMGTLSPNDKRYLAENFVAFFNRDYRRVAELHIESEWVPRETRVDQFEAAIRSVCEPIFERPLKEISFGHLLVRLFQTARRFNMEVQPQLVLLQKTLLNIEGLGRQLYPDLDLWVTAKPFLEDWMNGQIGVKAMTKELRRQVPMWAEKLPTIPTLTADVLAQARNGKLRVNMQSESLEHIEHRLQSLGRVLVLASGAASTFLGAVIIAVDVEGETQMFAGLPLVSWLLMAVSAGLAVSAWIHND